MKKHIALFCLFLSQASFGDASKLEVSACEIQKKLLRQELLDSFDAEKLKKTSSNLSASVTPTTIFYISNSKSMKDEARALDALMIEYNKKFSKETSFSREELKGGKSSIVYYANKEHSIELISDVLQVSKEKPVVEVNAKFLPQSDASKVSGLSLIRETKLSKDKSDYYVKTSLQGENGIYSKTVGLDHYLKQLLPADCAKTLADGQVVISISDKARGVVKEAPRSKDVKDKKRSTEQ